MALTFYWRCESATFSTPNDDYSDGDTTPTETGTLSYNSTQAFAGTNAAQWEFAENAAFDSASILSGAESAIGIAYYVSIWNSDGELFTFRDASTTADFFSLRTIGTSGSGNIRVRVGEDGVGGTNIDTSGLNLSTNTWYFIVVRWHETNTTVRIEVYNSSGSLIGSAAEDSSVGNWPTSANLDTVLIGDIGTGAEGWFDNVMFGDTYSEPLEDNYDITAASQYSSGASSGGALPLVNGGLVGTVY